MKLSKTQCITAGDGHAFHKRVINIWNALPECVVSANSRSTVWFKKNAPTSADYNYDPVQSILIFFYKLFVNDYKSCLVVKFPPHRTYVATIPYETQCSILH